MPIYVYIHSHTHRTRVLPALPEPPIFCEYHRIHQWQTRCKFSSICLCLSTKLKPDSELGSAGNKETGEPETAPGGHINPDFPDSKCLARAAYASGGSFSFVDHILDVCLMTKQMKRPSRAQ